MSRHVRRPLLAASCVLLSACATVQPVEFNSQIYGTALRENGVSVLVYAEKPLFVHTPGSVAGTGLIDDLTKPDGSMITLPSVSYLVASFLRQALVSQAGFNVEPIPENLLPSNEADQSIRATGAKKSFALKVSVRMNGLYYRPMAWSTYQYMLHARGTLIDLSNGKILWDNVCKTRRLAGRKIEAVGQPDIVSQHRPGFRKSVWGDLSGRGVVITHG